MKPVFLLCCFLIGVSGTLIVEGPLGRITGKIQKVLDVEIESFLGIPYAKPPVGKLRFALPEPFGAVGDLQATEFGPSCQQPSSGPMAPKDRKLSEDCLRVNVFRTRNTMRNDQKAVSMSRRFRASALMISVVVNN